MEFAGYKYLVVLAVALEAAIILLLYRKRPVWAIYAVMISIFMKGQYLWVGRPFYAWHIAAMLGLAALVTLHAPGRAASHGKYLNLFIASVLAYFVYSLAISAPMWLFFRAEGLGDIGTQVSLSRALTQILYFALLAGIFGFGLYAGKYMDMITLARLIILIATVASFFAIVQVLVVKFVGVNIFPIIGPNDTVRSAYIMDRTFRATSFAGEPKHLGLLISVGLTTFYVTHLLRIPVAGRFRLLCPVVMIVALLMSLSTTGLAISAAGIGIASVVFFRRLRKTEILAFAALAMLVIGQLSNLEGDFASSLERQTSKTDFEVQDQSVIEALLENPMLIFTGSGLGNIHLLAVEHLPANFPLFRDGGYKANSGLFFVIGDSGLIGLLLLMAGPFFALQAYRRTPAWRYGPQHTEATMALALMLMSLFSFLLRHDVNLFFFYGFVFTRLTMLRRGALQMRASHAAT